MPLFPFKIRVSPDVIAQEVLLGETVLMDVKTLVYFGLDELGSAVWRAIQDGRTGDEVFTRLRASTGRGEDELGQRFSIILEGLQNSRIIQLEEMSDGP